MNIPPLSLNTKAALLLTAPLVVGKNTAPKVDLLTHGEYNRLARRLHDLNQTPGDLLAADVEDLLAECGTILNISRLQKLLGRGFLLAQAIEKWQARAIWVLGRSDAQYPMRFKQRLREYAPIILYGCGEWENLDAGGVAVVGSRAADDAAINYAKQIGALSAQAKLMLISGAAKGTDRAAMAGALAKEGKATGILSDNLARAVVSPDNRLLLMEEKLTLLSSVDPEARFFVSNAMQRNKLIYALADVALVVETAHGKGGTWAGATEQLQKFHCAPVYVRADGKSDGLNALREMGAEDWPTMEIPEQLSDFIYRKDDLSTIATTKGQPQLF